MANASFSLIFSSTTGIVKKLLKIKRNKKKKPNKLVMLVTCKLNSIEKLVSQALINIEISHEEFKIIINEEENYRRLNEDIRIMKSSDEKDELIENNKNIGQNGEKI